MTDDKPTSEDLLPEDPAEDLLPEDPAEDLLPEDPAVTPADGVEPDASEPEPAPLPPRSFQQFPRLALFALPAAAVIAAAGAGFLGWQYASQRDLQKSTSDSVTAARDTTVAILSYSPESVDAQLNGARDRLTGSFLEAYTKLVNDVVIPGAKEKRISAVAKVPAAASVSATGSHAVVLVFVNQTVSMGTVADNSAPTGTVADNSAPTGTNSSVRVTLDKVDGRWLVSGFDPV